MSESAQARADRMADEVFAKGGVSGSIYRVQFCNWLEAEIRAAEQSARDSREPEVDELKGELALGEAENERLRAQIDEMLEPISDAGHTVLDGFRHEIESLRTALASTRRAAFREAGEWCREQQRNLDDEAMRAEAHGAHRSANIFDSEARQFRRSAAHFERLAEGE